MKPVSIDLDHIAHLARLRINPDRRDTLTEELTAILAFAAELCSIDTNGIEPTAHAAAMQNRFREDTVRPSTSREELLRNAPDAQDGCFIVPRVVE